MADYISREAAIEDFEYCTQENSTWTPQRVKTLLMRIPTADVEPVVHGRKIEDGDIGVFYLCSLCGECLPYGAKYFPNCGAKMDLEV